MSLQGKTTLLKTPLNPGTGYGKDGIELSQFLTRAGADLHLEPKYVGLPLPEDMLYLFAKPRPYHFDLAINHEYPGELAFPERLQAHADMIVGWTMYEFTSFGEGNPMTEQLRERLKMFDLVLAYDEISVMALREYMDAEDWDRLRILQGGYDSKFWKPTEEEEGTRNWDGTFMFAVNSTMNTRKNPWPAIFAFQSLKEEYGDKFDAQLHLKTTSLVFPPEFESWCPGIKVHFANWTAPELRRFYSKIHCLLAPSWGEGKNLPALEAQTSGVPVVVSNVGGHKQWADPSWTYLVDGPMEEHVPGVGSMRISMETMRETMWHIYNNRTEAKMKGELASRMIPQISDWENVLFRLDSILTDVEPRDRTAIKKALTAS